MDEKQKKFLIITLILIPVFIATLANSIIKIKKRYQPAPVYSAPALQPTVLTAMDAPKSVSINPAEPRNEELGWIRCPFCGKIYSGKEGGPTDLKLTGIVWDEKKPQALVNDLIVKEGDFIGRFKVIKIYKDKVRIDSNGTYFEIRLEQ